MSIKVGVNGFGRIGRLSLRAAFERAEIKIVALNAPDKTPEQLAYALKHDTVHGRFPGTVEIEDNALIVNGEKVVILNDRDPSRLNWGLLDVDYVLECTGKFMMRESARQHISAGAKVVILSGPPKDDTPMFVMGVNHESYTPDIDVVSNASCTTNCLAPLAKIVNDNWGIDEALMTTVHSATASENTVDGYSKRDWRMGRAAFNNIIPTSTGAAKAVGKVVPELKGKLTGMAFRVPISNVSVVDLTVKLVKPATYEEICETMRRAALGDYAGIVGYEAEEVVSSDFYTDPRTCIFDARAGVALSDNFVKLIAWYDNEWGFSNKMLDLTKHIHTVRTGEDYL